MSAVYATLAEDLHRQLDAMERVLREGDDEARLALVQSEGLPLVATLRVLLLEHQPDANGRCPTCRDRRFWSRSYWLGADAPCRVLVAARVALDGFAEPRRDAGRHHLRLGAA